MTVEKPEEVCGQWVRHKSCYAGGDVAPVFFFMLWICPQLIKAESLSAQQTLAGFLGTDSASGGAAACDVCVVRDC